MYRKAVKSAKNGDIILVKIWVKTRKVLQMSSFYKIDEKTRIV